LFLSFTGTKNKHTVSVDKANPPRFNYATGMFDRTTWIGGCGSSSAERFPRCCQTNGWDDPADLGSETSPINLHSISEKYFLLCLSQVWQAFNYNLCRDLSVLWRNQSVFGAFAIRAWQSEFWSIASSAETIILVNRHLGSTRLIGKALLILLQAVNFSFGFLNKLCCVDLQIAS
jgi:hypothetical protein